MSQTIFPSTFPEQSVSKVAFPINLYNLVKYVEIKCKYLQEWLIFCSLDFRLISRNVRHLSPLKLRNNISLNMNVLTKFCSVDSN
jgi:hypothetical protein